jgi:hypothetical protein
MDLENWMGCLKDEITDRKLSDIVIPGTHDSGSYCIDRKSKYTFFFSWFLPFFIPDSYTLIMSKIAKLGRSLEQINEFIPQENISFAKPYVPEPYCWSCWGCLVKNSRILYRSMFN